MSDGWLATDGRGKRMGVADADFIRWKSYPFWNSSDDVRLITYEKNMFVVAL